MPYEVWRKKRLSRTHDVDPVKNTKAERERFRRGWAAMCKKANDLYLDGIENGRDRRVYMVIYDVRKNRQGKGKYTSFNSHPRESWVPSQDEVDEHYPITKKVTPADFGNNLAGKPGAGRLQSLSKGRQRLFKISKPPLWAYS
ncbi:hypothetical protein BO86DRAFT_351530 [Aspergillus japonicus CBS 114.51]|uniref:Uncharacterized protein n=1 Tax=Aspergillus japonicus CBS 114.51 TaxID=1448312 RepID=A0A8T8XGX5_ASPJA|nr:hypothetical protein BO86DRAFT_351530 [Aspergillus japonicus CBS 114.51]RAH87603.1 hypothetical protein BO86DRAFT_351530 [Aspergillus japonicus CBS 114.51]